MSDHKSGSSPNSFVITSALYGSAEIAFNVFDTFRGAEAGPVYGKVVGMTRALFGTDVYSNDWLDFYFNNGMELTTAYHATSHRLGREVDKILGHKVLSLPWFGAKAEAGWDLFMDMIQWPEAAPRIVEMRAIARELLWDPSKPLDEATYNKLIMAGKEVTVDFTNGGRVARTWNQIVPFFNANVKGVAAWADIAKLAMKNTPEGHTMKLRVLSGLMPLVVAAVSTFCSVDDQKREFGDAVGEQMFEQEYLCSFEQPVVGAIYAAELRAAREQGRIGRVPYDPLLPVHTWWDIGGAGQGGDATGVWFIQKQRAEVRAIRYHESTGKALPYYAKYCTELPYRYGTHWFPHDARAKSLGSGRSIEELAGGYYDPTTGEQVPGMLPGEVKISPAVNVEDRINAGRSLFPRMWFDETNCADGLDALSNYRREWKDKLMQLNAAPLHDWSSHGADAYGEIALTEQQTGAAKPKKPDLSKRLGGSGWA